ncbi:MAG: SulP family inorganic anion transporter [Opitutaceae bacterium]
MSVTIPAPSRWRWLEQAMPDTVAAIVCAFVTLAYAAGYARILFIGPLDPFIANGVVTMVASSAVVILVLSFRSSFELCLGGPDANLSAILAVASIAIVQSILLTPGTTVHDAIPTVLAFIFLTAIACGVTIYFIGARGWGRYVRYVPYPVVGGFLAGTGFLLIKNAAENTVGFVGLGMFEHIRDVHPLNLATALVVAAVLVIAPRIWRQFWVFPMLILAGIALFHVVRHWCGIDLAQARELGWVLAPLQLGDWAHIGNLDYGAIRWDLIALHAKDAAAVAFIGVLTALLNDSNLELATSTETSADHELKALGLSNILAGALGGVVAVKSFNRTILILQAGARTRWAARLTVLFLLAAVAFMPRVVAVLPRSLLTGIILYLGINILIAWVWDARRKMPFYDYLIVLAILGMVVWLGAVSGVALGIVICCLSLIVALSRTPSVKFVFNARQHRSNVEYPADQVTWLEKYGDAVQGFVLQGVLFFGTASSILEAARKHDHGTRSVLLDFRLVQRIDSSCAIALNKLLDHCRRTNVHLVFTGLTPRLREMLRQGSFRIESSKLKLFPDLDRGLEWCEQQLLLDMPSTAAPQDPLDVGFSPEEKARLLEVLESFEVAAGTRLVKQGEASDTMLFVESGCVSVYVTAPDGTAKRLRRFTSGTLVGEMGFYTRETRSADIVADEPARLLRLTTTAFSALERDNPALAHAVHSFVVRTLARRLRTANRQIVDLL